MSIKIFCYAHEDIKWLNELKKHLDQYKRTGTVEIWHDADISAGVEWEPEIAKQYQKISAVISRYAAIQGCSVYATNIHCIVFSLPLIQFSILYSTKAKVLPL